MKTFIPGIGPVDDSIAPGQPGGPPATVATGASGDVPVDPGQSPSLAATDPTAAPAPGDSQPGVLLDGTGTPI